jgi:hypothetical protein
MQSQIKLQIQKYKVEKKRLQFEFVKLWSTWSL